MNVVGIIDLQHKMFGVCFEGYIVNMYGSTNVPRSGFKYIHCDLIDPLRYLTITLTIGSSLVSTFFPHLNVGSFIRVFNFEVTFRNKFERANWEFVLRVGATTIIEQIDHFLVYLQFVPTHSILDFMQKENLKELRTMELVVIRIYGLSAKVFILVIANGLGSNDAHALSFYPEFFAQWMQLIKMYSTSNWLKNRKLLLW
jgi:hypothetical protein